MTDTIQYLYRQWSDSLKSTTNKCCDTRIAIKNNKAETDRTRQDITSWLILPRLRCDISQKGRILVIDVEIPNSNNPSNKK